MSFFEFPHTRTYDSDLGWLIKQCKTYGETLDALNAWKAEVDPEIDDFKKLYDMMLAGDLPAGVQNGIEKWMREHARDVVGELVKLVFFGLNDSGHFVAYIPESWEDIIFNTTEYDIFLADYPEYGRLVLSFEIGGA